MKTKVISSRSVALMLFAAVASLSGNAFGQGFSGAFAPGNWQTGSNSPGVNLVTFNAPGAATITNYAPWAVSGAGFSMSSAPSAGTISFSYVTSGTDPVNCPASYKVGETVKILADGSSQASFQVAAGQSFGFALNGQNLPDNFGCTSNGASISFTVSNFAFTPSAPSEVALVTYQFNKLSLTLNIMVQTTPTKCSGTNGVDYMAYPIVEGSTYSITPSGRATITRMIPKHFPGTQDGACLWATSKDGLSGSYYGIDTYGIEGEDGGNIAWTGAAEFTSSLASIPMSGLKLISAPTNWPPK